jgi:hypothetical protein
VSISAPEWLKKRGGELRPGISGNAWFVYFEGEPQYRLTPIPTQGQHGCRVVQTINGSGLDGGGPYPTEEDAIRGGLEALRKELGW